MKNKRFLNKIFLIFATVLTVFTLSGCSLDYLAKSGNTAFNQMDYLYAVGCYKGVLSQQPYNMSVNHWIGKSYLAAGDADRAIDYLNKVIESNNSDAATFKVDSYQSLAQASYKNGEYQKALEFYKKANDLAPGTDLQNLNLYTDVYDINNQIKAAIDLQKRANYSPEYLSRQYRILSYLYNRDHNYDEAAKMGLKAVEAFPDNEMAYYLIGISSGQRGYYDKAIEAIRKATKIQYAGVTPQERFPMYISLAYYLTKNGQYDEAIAAYNQATQSVNNKTTYNDYSFVKTTALAFYSAGRYDEALYVVNKFIIPLEKSRVGIYLRDSSNLKSSYGDSNYYVFDVVKNSPAEKAGIEFGDKIIAINGVATKGWSVNKIIENLLGAEGTKVTLKIHKNTRFAKHFQKDKLKKEFFETTLTREFLNSKVQKKELADIYGIRSLIYRAQGNNKNALTDAEKAHMLYPETINTMLAYGLSKVDKGDYAVGLNTLSEIKPEMIENARLYNFSFLYFFVPFPSDEEQLKLGKAIAYAKLGKLNEAISLIPDGDTVSQLPPIKKDYQVLSNTFNQIAQYHIEKAVNFEKNGDIGKALDEYAVASTFNNDENKNESIKNSVLNLVRNLPGSPPLPEEARKHMIRAGILFTGNDIKGSLNEYKKALKLAPYFSKLYFNTAMMYGELKNYDKAISYMKNYINLAPEAPNIQEAKDEIIRWELLSEKAGI